MNLDDLTQEELELLWRRCNGEKQRTTEVRMTIGSTKYANVYREAARKLGYGEELGKTEKWAKLSEEYCAKLSEVKVDVIKNHRPGMKVFADEGEVPPATPQPTPPEPQPEPPPPPEETEPGPPRLKWWYILIFIGVMVLAYFVIRPLRETHTPPVGNIITETPTATRKPVEQVVVEPTATIPPTREFNAPPVKPTNTHTSTTMPTNTPTITLTPPPPTDTLIPTPTSAVLFEDDANAGPNPGWDIPADQLGELFWVSGTFTVTGKVWMYVGSTDWKNYKVVIDANVPEFRGNMKSNEPDIFAIRVADPNNFVAFQFQWGGAKWWIVKNGEWTEVPNTWYDPSNGPMTIILTADGNKFSVNIRGEDGPSFITDKFPTGGVGLFIADKMSVDNFKVVGLP